MSEAGSCLVCHEQRPLSGVACAECLEEIKPAIAITPEQVRMRGVQQATTAVFVDPWGRAHLLGKRTAIGRVPEEQGPQLIILDATISRRQATLVLRDGAWLVRDLASINGTFIEGKRIAGETRLRDGERIKLGEVSFFFLDGVTPPPEVDTGLLRGHTVRGSVSAAVPQPIEIELREPSGGGGGVAVIDGRQVQLTLPQFELLALLYQRARTASSGFVQASELVRRLSLDSAEPSEGHIRQLVRRLRRVLFRAGIQGLIESRYGFGYRLVLLA